MKLSFKKAKEWLITELEKISDSPQFEANELLAWATGKSKDSLYFIGDKALLPKQIRVLKNSLKKRKRGIPLQYILGEWEFYSAPFYVGKGVLVPRADSELLVDLALDEIEEKPSPVVFDLCSGSGAIGIAVALNSKSAKITLVEKSKKAFKYLIKNCELNKVSLKKELADITVWQSCEKADLILCNPPYITASEMKKLQTEVKKEPHMALFGGEDGLEFYRLLADRARLMLKPTGKIFMEIGFKQGADVKSIFEQSGYTNVEIIKDLSNNDRVVIAQND